MEITSKYVCPQTSGVIIDLVLAMQASCPFLLPTDEDLEVLPDGGGLCHCEGYVKVQRVNTDE